MFTSNHSAPNRRPLVTDLNAPSFTGVSISLVDLHRAALRLNVAAIENRTFLDCRLEGPAVMLALYQTSKAGVERFTRTLREELDERGIRVTLLRAAGMMEEGMNWTLSPEVMRRFREERARRGIDQGENAVSQFASVAELLPWLIGLPADVQVTELMLEARQA